MYLCRWDEGVVDLLPEYLKGYYLNLLNTANEIERELQPSEKYRISFYQNAVSPCWVFFSHIY